MTSEAPDDRTVLIADDESMVRRIVARCLVGRGFRVVEAGDGKEALARTLENPPDLVILDLCMPRLDGSSVCRALRGDERTHGLPILILTGMTETHTEIELLELGADDYMPKPFDPDELRARVRALLRRGGPPAGAAAPAHPG